MNKINSLPKQQQVHAYKDQLRAQKLLESLRCALQVRKTTKCATN